MATPPRGQFYDVALSTAGVPVTTTRVTVYQAVPYAVSPLTTTASIYSGETGAGTPGNPFNATTGEINFWAAAGSYDLKIEDTGSPAKFATKYVRWDCVPGDKGIITAQVADDAVTNPKVADNAIGTPEITDGSVGTAELATNSVTTIKITDANVTDVKMESPNNSIYKNLLSGQAVFVGGTTYAGTSALPGTVIGSGNGGGYGILKLLSTELAVNNKTTKLRLDLEALVNDTGISHNVEFGLYPVTAISGATNSLLLLTLGSVVAGSTVSVPTSVSNIYTANSGDFTIPANGNYAVAYRDVTGGGLPANHRSIVNAILKTRNV